MTRYNVDIPEGSIGDFTVKKITSNYICGRSEPLDTYTVLSKEMNLKNSFGVYQDIMQDTIREYEEHRPLWDNATGNVLIGGLGIGFSHQKLVNNPKVTSVTVVEKHQEVIDLVWDYCSKDHTFSVICADIETWEPTQHYDVGWFDSWIPDHPTMTKRKYDKFIRNKYSSSCDWIGIWQQIDK